MDEALFIDALNGRFDKLPKADKANLFMGFVLPAIVSGLEPKPTQMELFHIGNFVIGLFEGKSWKESVKTLASSLEA